MENRKNIEIAKERSNRINSKNPGSLAAVERERERESSLLDMACRKNSYVIFTWLFVVAKKDLRIGICGLGTCRFGMKNKCSFSDEEKCNYEIRIRGKPP